MQFNVEYIKSRTNNSICTTGDGVIQYQDSSLSVLESQLWRKYHPIPPQLHDKNSYTEDKMILVLCLTRFAK